jgi:DNA-binding transcriptional ArsR family regulator
MPDASDAASFDRMRAELFDALGHPVRIRILHALEDGPLGFSDLRRKVGLESGGHLQFHLGKLDGLVKTTADNTYMLTDDGREALRIVSTQTASSRGLSDEKRQGTKIIVSRAVLAGLIAAVVLLASLTGAVYWQMTSQLDARQREITRLQGLAGIAGTHVDAIDNNIALRLTVSVNSTVVATNQTVTVGVFVSNVLTHFNNITASNQWGYAFPTGLCGKTFGPLIDWAPYNLALFSGFYTLANVSEGTPIPIYYQPPANYTGPYFCPLIMVGITSFDFYPSSGTAVVNRQVSQSPAEVDTIGATLTLGVGTTSNSGWGYPVTFSPGVYTVLAGDEWGQLAVIHFVVSQ